MNEQSNGTVHGALVVVNGVGALLQGASGTGKSLTALLLIRKGHKLVADDVVRIERRSTGLMGMSLEAHPRIEVRGLGIFSVERIFPGSVLHEHAIHFVADLRAYNDGDVGRTAPDVETRMLMGAELPKVSVPIADHVDPSLWIEILVADMSEWYTTP